jgi:hypothetical protein
MHGVAAASQQYAQEARCNRQAGGCEQRAARLHHIDRPVSSDIGFR